MKKFLLFVFFPLLALGDATTPVLIVVNNGSYPVPTAAQYSTGHSYIRLGNPYWAVVDDAAGLGIGAQIVNWNQWGTIYANNPTPTFCTADDTNITVLSWQYIGTDPNNSPQYQASIAWNPAPACPTNVYSFTLNDNPTTNTIYVSVFFNGVHQPAWDWVLPPFTGGTSSGYPSGTPYPNNEYDITATTCDQPITFAYSNSPPGVNVPIPPLTNVPPDTASPPPPVAPTNPPIPWTPDESKLFTEDSGEKMGNALNGAIWTANNQSHVDMSGVVNAINTAKNQAHSDMNGLNQNLGGFRNQNHTDLQALDTDLKVLRTGLTNNTVNVLVTNQVSIGFTNYASESNQLALLSTQVGASNLLAGLVNGTNGDVASETTQVGISNLLAGIATNGLVGTNGGPWTNGLTLDQLTSNAVANQLSLSNSQSEAMAAMSALTNQASQMGMGSVVGQASAALGGDVQVDSGGSGATYVIPLAGGVNIVMGAAMPSYGGMRTLLACAVVLGLFAWNWRTTYLKIRDVFTAQQARTAGTQVLGTNVNLSSAMLMAIAIFAACTAIPVFAAGVLSGEIGLVSGMGNPVSLIKGFGFGYAFLSQYVPIVTVVSAVCWRVVFMVTIDSIAGVVMGIKLFLVGL